MVEMYSYLVFLILLLAFLILLLLFLPMSLLPFQNGL